jgi:molybdopterin converting factor small subunit
MTLTIKYMAQVRHAAGTASEVIEVEDSCTVARLLRFLSERYGEPVRRFLLDAAGGPQPALLVFVGDRQERTDITAVLKEGEVVTIMTPMAGG